MLSSINIDHFINDYNNARINDELINYLRDLTSPTFLRTYSEDEKQACLKLLREVIDTFLEKYEDNILNEISKNQYLEATDLWKYNCYLLSMAILTKICGPRTAKTLFQVLVERLDELNTFSTDGLYVTGLIETYLFAVCNLLNRPDLPTEVVSVEKWLRYTRLESNDAIKILSSYIIVYLNNRDKMTGVKYEDILKILECVSIIFDEVKSQNRRSYRGFTCGEKERSELTKGMREVVGKSAMDRFMQDYRESRINTSLTDFLRRLDTKNEQEDCISFLKDIREVFLSKYQDGVSEVLATKKVIDETNAWKLNCYMLAVAFLSKIGNKETKSGIMKVLIKTLEELSGDETDETSICGVKTTIESYLLAMCNILREPDLAIDMIVMKMWLPYTQMRCNNAIKLSSSYIIMYFNNRDKMSGIDNDTLTKIVNYVRTIFADIERQGMKEYHGFICGETEREELKSGINKINQGHVNHS